MATAYPSTPGVRFKLVSDIPGREAFTGYCIGDDASFWSCRERGYGHPAGVWRRISPVDRGDGYPSVKLHGGAKPKIVRIHILMLEAFVGPRPPGMWACHFPDPDRRNCALSNLKWGTPSENNQHKKVQGSWQGGVNHPFAKLTEELVVAIRKEHSLGVNFCELSRRYGVSRRSVQSVVWRKTWSHV